MNDAWTTPLRLDWLMARPIAHRGLHDAAAGVIENTPSAFSAAIAGGYGIECDVQLSRDGEAMVHHDGELGRLTEAAGPLARYSAAELHVVPFRNSADRMFTLGELCALVGGRVPLVVEMKRQVDAAANLSLVERAIAILRGYSGPAALMSFDPRQIEALRARAPEIPRGIVAERAYDNEGLAPEERRILAHLLHANRTRPHFVAYRVADLPSPAPLIARWIFGLPLLTWTVRTTEERARAARWASQIIFEGFRP